MKVVQATEADIPALNVLVHKCYRGPESFQGWTSEANMLDGNRTTPERLAREMSNPSIKFLKGLNEDGEMIACCLTQQQDDAVFTGMLCVQPHLQGSGLGKKMMAAVGAWAKENNCSKIKIEVISARKELVQWYERQGFVRTGKATPFPPPTIEFGIPKDDFILMEMEKPLD